MCATTTQRAAIRRSFQCGKGEHAAWYDAAAGIWRIISIAWAWNASCRERSISSLDRKTGLSSQELRTAVVQTKVAVVQYGIRSMR